MSLELIITGGTIDKNIDKNSELSFTNSSIPSMIKEANLNFKIKLNYLMLKDSLDMTLEDRKKILKECRNSKSNKILISHGTDSMIDTSKFLLENIFLLKDKTIVLFGAMRPYSFKNSDAQFNFGYALSSVLNLKSGVYIGMSGEIFNPENVYKNRKKGIFMNII